MNNLALWTIRPFGQFGLSGIRPFTERLANVFLQFCYSFSTVRKDPTLKKRNFTVGQLCSSRFLSRVFLWYLERTNLNFPIFPFWFSQIIFHAWNVPGKNFHTKIFLIVFMILNFSGTFFTDFAFLVRSRTFQNSAVLERSSFHFHFPIFQFSNFPFFCFFLSTTFYTWFVSLLYYICIYYDLFFCDVSWIWSPVLWMLVSHSIHCATGTVYILLFILSIVEK